MFSMDQVAQGCLNDWLVLHDVMMTIIAEPVVCWQKKLMGLYLTKDVLSLCISLTRLIAIHCWLEFPFPMGICTLP